MPGEPRGAIGALEETIERLRVENEWMWSRLSEPDRLALALRRAGRVAEKTITLPYWQETTELTSSSVEEALNEVWGRLKASRPSA